MSSMPFGAVILAGGAATRLGGADKAGLRLGGHSLLDLAVDAVADAAQVVVVGPPGRTRRPVTFTRESPPRGGPAAALLAGRDALAEHCGMAVVLAVDMPHLSRDTTGRLLAAATAPDGAVLVGPDGRRQIALALHVARLDAVRPGPEDAHGLALHRLLAGLDLVEVVATGREHRDVDTWTDFADAAEPPT